MNAPVEKIGESELNVILLIFDSRDVFRTQWNMYDRAF